MGVSLTDMKDGLVLFLMASGPVSVVVVALLAQRFASKTDLAAQVGRLNKLEERLAQGDARFATLEGAIKAATQAAGQAKSAAEEATKAAAKVYGTEIACARLEERIQGLGEALNNIEHFTRLMVEGHMKLRA